MTHPITRFSERRARMVVLRRRIKTLDDQLCRIRKIRLPIVTELQALIFETSAEYWGLRPATTVDREADDVQVWILRQKGCKA